MATFIGKLNGIKALAHLVTRKCDSDALAAVYGWDASDTDVELTEPEAETQARMECNAPEIDDVNYCTCGLHQWDANAMNGLGDVVPCGPDAPWRVERRK
jgi:hypothetical protein